MNPYLKDLMAFADLLSACNVIDEDAVCFSDEYDGGRTLGNIAEAHRRLNAENDVVGVASHAWLAPFVAVAKGIPDNWPGACILRFGQRHDGSIYLSYHGINDASHGITINQWRALLGANADEKGKPMNTPCKTEDDCPTPTWCRGKNRCPKQDAKEPRKIGWLARIVLGSWHSAWACYHLERVGDPVTYTCSDGSCRHDNRYKHHRRALNKLSENAGSDAPGANGKP